MKKMISGFLVAGLGLMLAMPASAGEVDRRQQRQQARIGEGVESGELNARETARLERKEARIHSEVARDRAANGGKLTPAERRRINRQENRVSRQIYREKHD